MSGDIGIILVFALIWAKWGDKIFEIYQRIGWIQEDLSKIAKSIDSDNLRKDQR